MSRAAAIAEAVRVAASISGRTAFIGIDGFGAAGKSSLAAATAADVPAAQVVHVDDFSGPGIAEWDWARFRTQVLSPLLAGRPARYQVRDRTLDRGGDWIDVQPATPLIVEGVSSTRVEAGVPWDLTVWVETPREVRLHRAIERDGYGMLSRWLDDWMPSEQAYAEREHPSERVDLVVSGIER